MTFYDYKVGLSEEQCVKQLYLAFGNEAPSLVTVFRTFAEFRRGRSSLCNEKHTAVTPENVSRVCNMVRDDNRCTLQMLEATLGIGSAVTHKILHE